MAESTEKKIVGLAKTLKRDESLRDVQIDIDGAAVAFRFSTGEAIMLKGVDEEFPKWRQLIPTGPEKMGGVVGMGYNPGSHGEVRQGATR